MAKFLSKDGKFYMWQGKLLRYSATLEGTWVFNNTLTAWPTSLNNTSISVACISNSKPFENFDFVNGDSSSIKYGTTTVKATSWSDVAYRIVTFALPFDGTDNLAFYDWFVTNAIKSDCLNWKLNPSIECSTTTTYPASTVNAGKQIPKSSCSPLIQNVSFTVSGTQYNEISVSGTYYRGTERKQGDVYSYTETRMYLSAFGSTTPITLGTGSSRKRQSTPVSSIRYPSGNTSCSVTTSEQVLTFTAIPTGTMLTWLFNNATPQVEVPVSKTWVINETPDLTNDMNVNINFTSNGISYKYFVINSSKLNYNDGIVCDDIGFIKEAYRTIVFETAPTGELLAWLQANAVPQ